MKKSSVAKFFLVIALFLGLSCKLEAHLSSYEAPYMVVKHICSDGNGAMISLHDGSQWKVSSNGKKIIQKHWNRGIKILIHPTSFFDRLYSSYWLVNAENKSYVYAHLSKGPSHSSQFTHFITGQDYQFGLVRLQSGIHGVRNFVIDAKDLPVFREWSLGHTVIVGSNMDKTSQMFSKHPYILINHNTQAHVRAYQVN